MDTDAFIAVHRPRWDRLQELTRSRELDAAGIDELLALYQETSTHLSTIRSTNPDPVLISRLSEEIICYNSACPHLGCIVRWDGASDQFRCACHGGAFDRNAQVVAGPPPRALDRYKHKVEGDQLLVLI